MEEQDNLETELDEALETDNPQGEADEAEANSDEDPTIVRYKQQIKGSTEEAQRLRQMLLDAEIAKAGQDANAVLELHKKDPKLAKEVAKHYGFNSIEAIEDYIAETTGKKSTIDEDELNRRAERLAEKKLLEKQHELALQRAEKLIGKLPEDLQEDAKAYFDEITEGKLLDDDKARKFAEMATLYVQKNTKGDKTEALAKLSSTGLKNTKKTGDEPQLVVKDGKLVLSSN